MNTTNGSKHYSLLDLLYLESSYGVFMSHTAHYHMSIFFVTDANYTCAHCQAQFVEKSNFDLHLKYSQACHDANPQVFKCGKCGEVFTTLINLQQHIRRHEQNKHSKHFRCNKSFTQNEDLQEHSHAHSTVHPCDGQEQNCPKTSLKPHAGEKCLQCEYCSKTFKFKSKLKRHLLVHTGEKPYKCQYCSKSFRQKDSFNYHLLTQHAGKKPYCCQHCSKSFPLLSRLQYH